MHGAFCSFILIYAGGGGTCRHVYLAPPEGL